ncbi:2-amino-4-hydroxy-6-hydroxymethyldihydropteridine diphosphokinase [Skermania sp. ID1734]|uniref:2-amino-4-hydroxy-6- hydroxymethyldihydropteridine diphosphokinase n=1 Tax=Skermania sp. ID1734 TaxID=2597516 RepID=UPI00117E7FD1|nr:2-amino-4-hydroxy-6-hydroxymethyldihydropteridine diphosphokinase [Skermania sp. ID1734]TSD95603.1 2-amino-4-hydroxy-6-hydroxymethyldihydropteridine diphosphokinase [Skermania sp. ID1734]
MSQVVLSIGSNVGDSHAHLQGVLDRLGPRTLAVSRVYRTPPWGGVEQQDFLNAIVIAADTELDCRGWLRLAQDCERAADRVRDVRWGPRTLDVDIIDCDGRSSADPELTLPHPRAKDRAFVLVPWLEIDPAARLLVGAEQVPLTELLDGLDPAEIAGVRATELTLAGRKL